MKSVQLKIQQAANLFQTHDFKKSLNLYEQCIAICKKNQLSTTLIYNLVSCKGALMSILGDQKGALQCLNEVLKDDPHHSLCLMRRSQVFKKKNLLSKALKDLKLLSIFSPDNLQIAAMKVQIQNLKVKYKQVNSSSESENEQENQSEEVDEEEKLNFLNLKFIERKSVSILIKPGNTRKSRVTIAGDIAIEYEANDDEKDDKGNQSFASTSISKEYAKEKYMRTFKEIELDDQNQSKSSQKSLDPPVLKIKPTTPRTKSILKNRDSVLYITNEKQIDKQKKYGGRQSKMIELLKNIDGKVISTTSNSIRQVQFKKSSFNNADSLKSCNLSNFQQLSNTRPKNPRKSCLKRCSFEVSKEDPKVETSQKRKSKFDTMPKNSIDGFVIKSSRKSIDLKAMKQNINNDSGSDEGSQHNIFGSNQFVISKEIRENLGLGEDSEQQIKRQPKVRVGGSKSILKKNSVLMKSTSKENDYRPSPLKQAKKAKKSVMFTKAE